MKTLLWTIALSLLALDIQPAFSQAEKVKAKAREIQKQNNARQTNAVARTNLPAARPGGR